MKSFFFFFLHRVQGLYPGGATTRASDSVGGWLTHVFTTLALRIFCQATARIRLSKLKRLGIF